MTTRRMIAVTTMMAASAMYATTYYVDASRPDDLGNGLSWAKAKKTIQAAVDLAIAGDTVLVTNGTYSQGGAVTPGQVGSNRVVITKNITVRSMHGPAVTIIQGQGPRGDGAVRGVYMSAGILRGFTVTNGYTRWASGEIIWDSRGGGVNMYDGSGVVSNCIIRGNQASRGGGVAYGTVMNCIVSDNRAGEGGGTYYSTVINSTISGNVSTGMGGGAMYGGVSNCTISGNSSIFCGGGVAAAFVNNSTISGNCAFASGGGAYYVTGNCCIISGNHAGYGGGCSQSELKNCLIVANTADSRGGGTCGCVIQNCTIVDNSTTNEGGGTCECRLRNSIVWGNRADVSSNNNYASTLRYSCTPRSEPGAGNINSNPQFINAAAGNYRLSEASPCINAGENLPEMAWQTDLDGNPRVYMGDDSGRVDMGCYEFVPEAGELGIAVFFMIYELRMTIWGRRRREK